MTISITPKLESALVAEASRRGIAPEELAVNALNQRFLPPTPRDEWEKRLLLIGADCGVSLSHAAVSSDGIYD